MVSHLTLPYPVPDVPGSVFASPSFTQYYNCSCSGDGSMVLTDGVGQCDSSGVSRSKYIIAICLVGILPWLVIGLGIYIFVRCVWCEGCLRYGVSGLYGVRGVLEWGAVVP